MANFNHNNRSGGKKHFSDRSSDRASMHPAICSSCGKECEVPFKPTGSKPIFCSKCFETHGGPSSRRYEDRGSARSSFREREMFEAVCDTCGNTCKLPFRPTNGKPIYCSNCFEHVEAQRTNRNDYRAERKGESCHCGAQMEELNAKLDQILRLLTPVKPVKIAHIEDLINKPTDTQSSDQEISPKKTKVQK